MSQQAGSNPRSLHRRVFVASAWAVVGKFATVALTFVLNVVLARRMDTAALGEFFLVSSFVYIVGTIGTLGVNAVLLRSIAGDGKVGLAVSISTAWTIVSIASVLIGVLSFGVLQYVPLAGLTPPTLAYAALIALWIPVQALTQLLSDTFRGLHDIRLASFFDGTQGGMLPIAISNAVLLLAPQGMLASLTSVLLLVVSMSALNLFAGMALLSWRLRFHAAARAGEAPVPTAAVGPLILHSLPFLGTTLFLLLRTQLGLWIVGIYGSAAQAAVFGIAQRVMNAVMLPSMVITNTLQPTVAQLFSTNRRDQIEPLLRRMATWTTIPIFGAVIVLQLFGPFLLRAVFGEEYGGGGIVLQVLAIGNLLFAWCGAPGLVLSMGGAQRINMSIYGFTVVLTCLVGIPATRELGMLGMAYTIGVLGIVNKGLTMWVVHRRFGIRTDVTFDVLPKPRSMELATPQPPEA